MIFEPFQCLGKDPVVEDDGGVGAGGPGLSNGVDEGQLRAAVSGKILDKKHSIPSPHYALDSRIPTVALGFLPDVGHGQAESFRHKGGKRNASRFTAGDIVKGINACAAQDACRQLVHETASDVRVGDQLPAVDIGW